MTRADAFSEDMRRELGRRCGLEWECGKPEKGQRECVDVLGKKDGKARVLIEIELRRGAPFQNIVKVWQRIEAGTLGKNIVLVQAFSKFYGENSTRRRMASFIGQKMVKEFPRVKYISLPIAYSPEKRPVGNPVIRGGGRRKKHAIKLARTIVTKLRTLGFKAN